MKSNLSNLGTVAAALIVLVIVVFLFLVREQKVEEGKVMARREPSSEAARVPPAEESLPKVESQLVSPAKDEGSKIPEPKAEEKKEVAVPDELAVEVRGVADTFRESAPDIEKLKELIRSLALRAKVVEGSVKEERNEVVRGELAFEGSELKALFGSQFGFYRISFQENLETAHAPFGTRELTIGFRDDGGIPGDPFATVQYHFDTRQKRIFDTLSFRGGVGVGYKVVFGDNATKAIPLLFQQGDEGFLSTGLTKFLPAPPDASPINPDVYPLWLQTLRPHVPVR